MGVRRTITVLVSVSAVALLSVPVAAPAGAAPTGVSSAIRYYEGRTGTVQWAIGAEFMAQLDESGAVLSICNEARVTVDQASGVNIVTMPATGNGLISLNGRENSVDAVSECTITITGNGATVELTHLQFDVTSAYSSDIAATIADDYTTLGSGASKRLPKAATRNRIAVTSPVILVESSFADILRGQLNPSTGAYDGPVPSMTTEAANLGMFRLVLKVRPTTRPVVDNDEG